MRKAYVWLSLGATVLALSLSAEAQQAGKKYRVGILSQNTASGSKRNMDPFREGLRELGYVEGKNIIIEYRYADRKVDRLPALATELVRTNVDVIVVAGSRAIMAAKQATSTIPIVVGAAADLVGTGVVASLARPGREHHGLHPYVYGVGRETSGAIEGGSFKSLASCRDCINSAGPGGAQIDGVCRQSVGRQNSTCGRTRP